jgi:S1-C subfamily serine protease
MMRLRLSLAIATLCVFAALPAPARAQGADFFAALVHIEAEVPDSARTAGSLGTRRSGSGVVIDDDGLVLTIGYLILEASAVKITTGDRRVAATVLAYDDATGLGLVRAQSSLDIAPLELGSSASLGRRDRVLVASHSGVRDAVRAIVVSRRPFAGSWEYLLERAIFTAPPHREYGGAALIGPDGKLLGIGSLMVGQALEDGPPMPGNMFVPIDLLKPVLADLVAGGRAAGPPTPWLGMFTNDQRGHVFVVQVADESPAAEAGIVAGDVVIGVAGQAVTTMRDMFRAIWALGPAGVEVPLAVVHEGEISEITVHSADRYDYLRLGATY